MTTARELADQVIKARRSAWDKSDPTTAIVSLEALNPDDTRVVRRIVAEAGYEGEELERVVGQVSALVVGQVEAMADNMPATGGD